MNGINYYRLKQTDFNGAFEYHGISTVDCKQSNNFIIYPNPFESKFKIQLLEDIQYPITVSIIDYLGRKVYSQNIDSQSIEISLDELSVGTYFVKVITETTQIVERIVKTK